MNSSRSIRSSSSIHHSRTSSRSSHHAVPVAAPFDPAVEQSEIAALTSSILLPPALSEPPAPSAAPSALPTPRLRFETFHARVDYRHDGDRWMDTDVMLAKRRKLKSDEAIVRWINVFWRTFHHKEREEDGSAEERKQDDAAAVEGAAAAGEGEEGKSDASTTRNSLADSTHAVDDDDPFAAKPEAPSAASTTADPAAPSSSSASRTAPLLLGTIDRRQYMSVHKLWFKALHKPYERSDAQTQAIKDWARDSWLSSQSAASLLDYPAFFDALFELVDLWSLTIEPTEYVHFLATLYHRVTRVKSWLGDNGEIITKYVWRKTKYVKPSAVYRPFQYNKYKDVKWKEASEVLHHLDSDDSSEEEDDEARDDEDDDDALIKELQQLSEDDNNSEPDSSDDDSDDDDEEDEQPLTARSTKTPVPLSPKGVVSPVVVSNPQSRHRTNPSAVPPLAIDPSSIARSLTDVEIEPPMSPYLDPPAVIPQTPGGEEDEESEDDEERRLRRSRRGSGEEGVPSSSASELDEDDPLYSPTSLQKQARYDSAMDVLAQQQHDRYLLLVANLATLLESQQRRLRRSNSTVLFSVTGRLTKDVDASLADVGYEMDELGGAPVGLESGRPSGVTRLEERPGGILRGAMRRFSRTEPIGCLVDLDDDERYMLLRGDGRRRNSAPYNVASFSCAGPRMYREEEGPSRLASREAKLRAAPAVEVDDMAVTEEAMAEEQSSAEAPAAVETASLAVDSGRPETSDMAQEDFADYMASLDRPKLASPRADEKLQLTVDSPLQSHMSLAQIMSDSVSPRHADSAPVLVPPATAAIGTPNTAAGPEDTHGANSLDAAARKGASSMKPAAPANNPPSPVFAQSKQRMSVSDSPSKAGSAAGKRRPSRERRDSQQAAGQPGASKRQSASTPKSRPQSIASAAAAGLTAIDESGQQPTDEAEADEAGEEEQPLTPGDQFADAAARVLAGRRGTMKAAQKLVDMRDKRLADMDGAKIRDEALAAEYDEEALRRRQLKSANLKQLKEIEDEDSRVPSAAGLDDDDKMASREGADERRNEALRRKKEAEERRKKEEEEKRRRKEEEERRAAEDKAATAKAEKDMASLLHEADSQRKVEQQLKAQKRELVSAEKANKRSKQREERARIAEDEHRAEQANREAEREERAKELAARKAAAAEEKQSKKAGRRGTVDGQAVPPDDADDEADDEGGKGKRGDGKRDSVVGAPQAAAVAERKARLVEEAKARQEALKERREQDEKAAADSRGKGEKKVLKAKAVKKAGKADDSSAVATEEESEAKTKTRADFMRARKLDKREEGEDEDSAAPHVEDAESESQTTSSGKGWTKDKSKDAGKGAKNGQDETAESTHAEAAERADRRDAADVAKGAAGNKAATATQNESGAVKAKQGKAGEVSAPAQSQQGKQAARKAGDDGSGSGSDESTTSSQQQPSNGDLSSSSSQLSTARGSVSKPRVTSILTPRSAAAKVLSDAQAKAERLKQRRAAAAVQAAQEELTLQAEQGKYTYGADWSTSQKQAYREAELAKEKAEEKAALLASGENGLLELKWAQKMEDIKRKEGRAVEREEKEKKLQELEKQKAEREKERAEERGRKEEERKEKAREKAEKEALRKVEVEQRKEAEKAEKEAKAQERGQKEGAGRSKRASVNRGEKTVRQGKGERAADGEDGAEEAGGGDESELASVEHLSDAAAVEQSGKLPHPTGSDSTSAEVGSDRVDTSASASSSPLDGASTALTSRTTKASASPTHASKFAVKAATEPKVIESTASAPCVAQPSSQSETDPRKMAAAKRREEAARRIEDMKRQREEQILQQGEKRHSVVDADEGEVELPVGGSVAATRKGSVAGQAEAAQQHSTSASVRHTPGGTRRVLHGAEREVRVVEDGSATVYEQPKDGEVKYWTRINAQDDIVSPRHKPEAEHAVKVVEDPSMSGLSSTPDAIERELQLLRRPQRQWGMALSKEEADGGQEQHADPVSLSQTDEEVSNWETARQRPRSSNAAKAAGLLPLPSDSLDPNGPFSTRHIATPRGVQQPYAEPLVVESPEMVRRHSPPHRASQLALAAQQESADSLGFDPPSRPRGAADSLSVHKASATLPPQPNTERVHEAEVHSRRHHMAELTDSALHSLAVHSDAAISEANARRWLLMEEVRSHTKEKEEQRRKRVDGHQSHDSEGRADERRRAELHKSEWESKRREMEQASEAYRQERRERRSKRRQEKERRRVQREEDANTLKSMREDILREKEQRSVRKRQEREALAAARLQVKKAKEEEVERRRREEEARWTAERTAVENERMEQEKKKEREKRVREEERAIEAEKVREMEEQLRLERVKQRKEEKEKAKQEREDVKREEMKVRVLAALKCVDEANQLRAQQLAREQQEREEARRVREERQEQDVRRRKLLLHTELAQWWQRRRERNERLEREHRRQVLEEEELRREEVTVLRTHKQRAKSSSSALPVAQPRFSILAASDSETHHVSTAADSRRDGRLRVELHARRALERLMTQHSFSRYNTLPAKTPLDKLVDSSRLPPLQPSQAFAGYEEKTAITILSVRHSSTGEEEEEADSFPAAKSYPFEHPSDTDLRYRKVPLVVQGNPSRHTGVSWRINEAKLRAERVVGGISPILPPALVKRVRGREADGPLGGFGAAVGRQGRERVESAEAVASSMWGNAREDMELVGKKQRAFLKKKRKSTVATHSLPPLHRPTAAARRQQRRADSSSSRSSVGDGASELELEASTPTATSEQTGEEPEAVAEQVSEAQQEEAELLESDTTYEPVADERPVAAECESAPSAPAPADDDAVSAANERPAADDELETEAHAPAGADNRGEPEAQTAGSEEVLAQAPRPASEVERDEQASGKSKQVAEEELASSIAAPVAEDV